MNGIQIGFIGAGKVGVSLGKYLKEKGRQVGGYYSLSPESAVWAAEFTDTKYYENLQEIIGNCDMLLFTVPDGRITSVWEEAKPYVSGKLICHCSGLHSSKIFSDVGSTNSCAYSIHPLMAVSSREKSWKELSDALFTIEGDEKYIHFIEEMFQSMGNRTGIISAENKIKYHAAAALSSNYMTALFHMSQTLFEECGFSEREAVNELYKLADGNLKHILEEGCISSLTGPIERNDYKTVQMHISVLPGEMKEAYRANASYLIGLAKHKHPDRDYTALENICAGSGKKGSVLDEEYSTDIAAEEER